MTQQEFETRTGLQVSASFYKNIVEVEYMKDETDKDIFCREWKEFHKMTQQKLDTIENVVRYPLSVMEDRYHETVADLADMRNQRTGWIEESKRLQGELESVKRELGDAEKEIDMGERDALALKWQVIRLKIKHGETLDETERGMALEMIDNQTAPANASGGDCSTSTHIYSRGGKPTPAPFKKNTKNG